MKIPATYVWEVDHLIPVELTEDQLNEVVLALLARAKKVNCEETKLKNERIAEKIVYCISEKNKNNNYYGNYFTNQRAS